MATVARTGTRLYPSRCNVCRVEFDYEAEFISCMTWDDGRLYIQCGKHTGREVHMAYENGTPRRDCPTCKAHGLDIYTLASKVSREVEADLLWLGASATGKQLLPATEMQRENDYPNRETWVVARAKVAQKRGA